VVTDQAQPRVMLSERENLLDGFIGAAIVNVDQFKVCASDRSTDLLNQGTDVASFVVNRDYDRKFHRL
jgi:hypothetical protein